MVPEEYPGMDDRWYLENIQDNGTWRISRNGRRDDENILEWIDGTWRISRKDS